MPTVYYQRSSASDLSSGGTYNLQLLETTAAEVPRVVSLNPSTTVTGHHFTEPGVPGADGVAGNYSVEVDIAVGDSNVMVSASVARVNSSGTVQAQSAFTAEQTAAGAVLTFNFASPNLGTWAAGNRLRFAIRYRNSHSHASREVSVGFNTADSAVVAPWSAPAPVSAISGTATTDISASGTLSVPTASVPTVSGTATTNISMSGTASQPVGVPTISGTATTDVAASGTLAVPTASVPAITGTATTDVAVSGTLVVPATGGVGPIPVVESTTLTQINGGTPPFDMPAERPDGDLYVLHATSDVDSPTIAAPTGWNTEVAREDSAGNTSYVLVAWRIGDNEPASYTLGGSSDAGEAWVTRVSGADPVAPINRSAISADAFSGAIAPSVIPDVANTLILRLFHSDGADITDVPPTQLYLETTDPPSAASFEDGPASGEPSGTAAALMSGSDEWIAATLAIAPAGGVDTVPAITGTATTDIAISGTVSDPSASPWVAFLTDTFTDDDLTPIYEHTPDVGGQWEELPFTTSDVAPGDVDPGDPEAATTAFFSILVFGNEAITRGDNKRTPTYRNTADPGADEYDITLTWDISDNATGQFHWLMFRMSPTGTAYDDVDHYLLVADPGFDQWELYRTVGGTRTVLDFDPGPVAIDNTTADVRVEVRTDGMKVYVNDVLTLESDDTTITQRGRIGVGMASGDPGVHALDSLDARAPVSVAVPEVSGTATTNVALSGTATAPPAQVAAVSGTLTVDVAASGTVSAPTATVPTVSGTAVTDVAVSGTLSVPTATVPTVSGTATTTIDLSGTLAQPGASVPEVSGTATTDIAISGTLSVPTATVPTVTGTAITTIALSGTVTTTKTASFAVPDVTTVGFTADAPVVGEAIANFDTDPVQALVEPTTTRTSTASYEISDQTSVSFTADAPTIGEAVARFDVPDSTSVSFTATTSATASFETDTVQASVEPTTTASSTASFTTDPVTATAFFTGSRPSRSSFEVSDPVQVDWTGAGASLVTVAITDHTTVQWFTFSEGASRYAVPDVTTASFETTTDHTASFDTSPVSTEVAFTGSRASESTFDVDDPAQVEFTTHVDPSAAFEVPDHVEVGFTGLGPFHVAQFAVPDVVTVEWTGSRPIREVKTYDLWLEPHPVRVTGLRVTN